MSEYKPIALQYDTFIEGEAQQKQAEDFFQWANKRRSVRDISNKPVDRAIIEKILETASTAPSGANKQPWTFCVVADQKIKEKIRAAAEVEEKKNYNGRMSNRWLKDLAYLGTNWEKPFLTKAPYLIIVFKRPYEFIEGER